MELQSSQLSPLGYHLGYLRRCPLGHCGSSWWHLGPDWLNLLLSKKKKDLLLIRRGLGIVMPAFVILKEAQKERKGCKISPLPPSFPPRLQFCSMKSKINSSAVFCWLLGLVYAQCGFPLILASLLNRFQEMLW